MTHLEHRPLPNLGLGDNDDRVNQRPKWVDPTDVPSPVTLERLRAEAEAAVIPVEPAVVVPEAEVRELNVTDVVEEPILFEEVVESGEPTNDFVMNDAPPVHSESTEANRWYTTLVKRAVRFVQDIPGLVDHYKKVLELPTLKKEREAWHDRMEMMFSAEQANQEAAKAEALGKTIDLGTNQKYKLEKLLGQGGFGAAYLAKDASGKRCVVKLSRPFNREAMFKKGDSGPFSFTEAATARTLILEIAALKRLNKLGDQNPGPDLVDAQFMPDPRNPDRRVAVVVMEYVDGDTLGRFTAKHLEEPVKIVEALEQVAEGLGQAHQVGIIHSDIRPGNIMVDQSGQAKLIDFGGAVLPQLAERQAQTKPEFNSNTGRRAVYAKPFGAGIFTESFVLPGEITSQARDRYSLGRTIEFLVFRKPNYLDRDKMAELQPTLSYPMRELAGIAKQLVRENPAQRISLTRVVELLKQLKGTEQQIEAVQDKIAQQAVNG